MEKPNSMPVKTRMTELCQALSQFGVWVRLHYVYPYPHVDEIIPLMAEGKILPYLDIPFQHASPRILKTMKRPASAENTLQRIKQWREICPELTIRSTFIAGFPGETEKDFEQTMKRRGDEQGHDTEHKSDGHRHDHWHGHHHHDHDSPHRHPLDGPHDHHHHDD